jgi:hypothetical protein
VATGFAIDPSLPKSPVNIVISVGGPIGTPTSLEVINAGVANNYISGLNKTYKGAGNYHGFNIKTPSTKRGKYSIYIYAKNISGTVGVDSIIAIKTLTINNEPVAKNIKKAKLVLNYKQNKKYNISFMVKGTKNGYGTTAIKRSNTKVLKPIKKSEFVYFNKKSYLKVKTKKKTGKVNLKLKIPNGKYIKIRIYVKK